MKGVTKLLLMVLFLPLVIVVAPLIALLHLGVPPDVSEMDEL